MAHKPIRASLHFDFDPDALLVVETAFVEGHRMAVLSIAPGRAHRGKQVTVYLQPEKARELAKQLAEVADGA